MKRSLLCILVLFAFGHISSQTPQSDSLRSNTAILFNIVDLNLQGYNGGVGFKFGLSNNCAILTGLDFSFQESNEDITDSPNDNYQSRKGIGITADVVKYSPLKNNLKIYYGGGVGLALTYYRYHYASGSYTSIDNDDAFSVSLRGILGFEYELNKTFSLGFQQVIEGTYSKVTGESGSRDDYADNINDTKNKNYNFGLGSTYLSLLLYF